MSLSYTLAVTSCGRWDLLEITLESYFRCCDVLPVQMILLEDGPVPPPISAIPEGVLEGVPVMLEINDPRIGQIRSCDRLMSLVETENVVWLEDDWLFREEGWLEPSFAILAQYPEIVTVSLRGRPWNHPLREFPDWPFLIAEPGWQGGWGGFSFNCGLRRRSDFLKMGSYAALGGTDMYACQSELAISKKYLEAGYRIADLGRPIVEHLGHGRSKTKEKF